MPPADDTDKPGEDHHYRERLAAESQRWANLAEDRARRVSWLASPLIQRHLNEWITGDAEIAWPEAVQRHYFPPERWGGRGLSLGCNHGGIEHEMVRSGVCASVDGYDISEAAVAKARADAEAKGLAMRFQVADVNTLELPQDTYSWVLIVMALHHFERLEAVFEQIHRCLRVDGVFVFNEFVGPTRFEWTDEQLRLANEVRAGLPEELRRLPSGELAGEITRPDLEHMIRYDPFEAIRSAEIMPLVGRYFRVLAQRDYGGTVLHLALNEIIANFDDTDEEHRAILRELCVRERGWIESGELPSDFSVVVAARRDSDLPAVS